MGLTWRQVVMKRMAETITKNMNFTA